MTRGCGVQSCPFARSCLCTHTKQLFGSRARVKDSSPDTTNTQLAPPIISPTRQHGALLPPKIRKLSRDGLSSLFVSLDRDVIDIKGAEYVQQSVLVLMRVHSRGYKRAKVMNSRWR